MAGNCCVLDCNEEQRGIKIALSQLGQAYIFRRQDGKVFIGSFTRPIAKSLGVPNLLSQLRPVELKGTSKIDSEEYTLCLRGDAISKLSRFIRSSIRDMVKQSETSEYAQASEHFCVTSPTIYRQVEAWFVGGASCIQLDWEEEPTPIHMNVASLSDFMWFHRLVEVEAVGSRRHTLDFTDEVRDIYFKHLKELLKDSELWGADSPLPF